VTLAGLCLFGARALYAVEVYQNDRDAADGVFGNIATWGQSPAPPANHFNYPVPIGEGARALGMGSAFTALSDDLSAIWFNPAGLVQMEKNEVQWMGGDHLTGVPYSGYFAANYMLQNRMNFALSFSRPYNPVGAYPDVIAGDYSGFTKWKGTGAPILSIPGTPGTKVHYFDIPDTAVQDFLKDVYREYINPAFQEDILTFTYATPLSPDNNLSMGLNVDYLYSDSGYQADGSALNSVSGYGVDLGFLYRYPMPRFGREFAVGLNLKDIAGQVRYAGDSSTVGGGREVTLAPVSTLGIAWKTNEYVTGSKLNLTADFVYINDPSFDDDANRQVNLGGEMWFFKDRIAPRAGYELYFNRQLSRATLGISFRMAPPTKSGLSLDYAFLFPGDNDPDASHWFSLSYRWGGIKVEIPLPEVNVSVDPPIFAPRRGELATFAMKADSPKGIDRWTLSIIDHNNVVVRTYQDRGDAPAQILWGGEDRQYRPLPDGEYTFLFTATDHEGSSSSTPVQTLKIYTPVEPLVPKDSIDVLRGLIDAQNDKEEASDQVDKANAITALKALDGDRTANQKIPAVAKEPVAPAAITPFAEAKAAAGAFSYPRVNDVPFPKSSVTTGTDGKKVYSVEYVSQADSPSAILKDAADVIRVSAGDVGMAVARYDVRATYGSREFRIVAPASAAIDLAHGSITREQFLKTASVTLDGSALSPSYP
jgi:hypothetical protein